MPSCGPPQVPGKNAVPGHAGKHYTHRDRQTDTYTHSLESEKLTQLIATEHIIPYTKSWSFSLISLILKAAYDDVIIIILFHMGK